MAAGRQRTVEYPHAHDGWCHINQPEEFLMPRKPVHVDRQALEAEPDPTQGDGQEAWSQNRRRRSARSIATELSKT